MARTAGLDVGDKTIGVALTDPLGFTAQGHSVLRRRRPEADLAALIDLLRRNEVERVVVGLPRNMNGTYGPRAELARQFADTLAAAASLPVELIDERLTTVQAQKALLEGDVSRARRRQVVDMVAAQLILQAWLDRRTRPPAR